MSMEPQASSDPQPSKPRRDWLTLCVLVGGLAFTFGAGPWQWIKASRLNSAGLMAEAKVVDSRTQWLRRGGTSYFLSLEWEAVAPDTGGPYAREIKVESDQFEQAVAAGFVPVRYLNGDASSTMVGATARRSYFEPALILAATLYGVTRTRSAFKKKTASQAA